jgi:aminoglycoside 6'-N-acetyltransferase I
MIVVRTASPEDAAGWLTMREDLWPDESGSHAPEIQRFFGGELSNPLEVLIALDENGRRVGFAELSIRSYAEGCDTDRVAFLEGWYVAPKARRRGVGRALMDATEQWARRQGCTELGSDALIDNELSAVAHRKLGFEEVAQIRCFRKELG